MSETFVVVVCVARVEIAQKLTDAKDSNVHYKGRSLLYALGKNI